MNRLDKRVIIWLLLFGLAVGCFVYVADDAAAVERPTGKGPYSVGYVEQSYIFTQPSLTKDNFTMDLRHYYPANTNGNGAEPDDSDAPYPTVIYCQQWGGSPSLEMDRDMLEKLASWGMVVTTYYWTCDGMPSDAELIFSVIMDHLEYLNETEGNPLFIMVDKNAFGVSGFQNNAKYAWITTSEIRWRYGDNRIKACFSMHHNLLVPSLPAEIGDFARSCTGWTRVDVPCAYMAQIGDEDVGSDPAQPNYLERNKYHYDMMMKEGPSHPNALVIVKGEKFGGPVRMDYWISFMLYWLDGREEYRSFLYGEDIIMEAASRVIDLRFNFENGDIFPPVWVEIEAVKESFYMDENVILTFNITGHEIQIYTEFEVEWIVNGDEDVITSTENIVYPAFAEPGVHKIEARWRLGYLSGWMALLTINVTNMPPLADPGTYGNVDHDTEVVFDGNASCDTISHNDNLEFNWSFPGEEDPEYFTDPTRTITMTSVGPFVATLWVRDPLGAESSASCTITVVNVVPSVTVEVNTEALEDEELAFTGSGIDTPSHIGGLMYWWIFGDGTVTKEADAPDAIHSYTTSETFMATLWVKDASGAVGKATVNISVTNVVPDGGFQEIFDGDLYVEQDIAFMCWYMDTPSDNLTLDISWDFGDGNTSEGPYVYHTYEKANEYTITLTIEDDDGATKVATTNVVIYASVDEDKPGPGFTGPMVVSVSILLVVLLGLAVVGTTEPGKYSLGLLGAPLFTKTKDVMDNKTRHALLGIIVTNPGVHYTALKKELDLANGAAAYHLDVLERESFIRSARDGKLKRFYSAHVKVPENLGRSPEETREAILELVREKPRISQLGLMEELGLDRDCASYYLRELVLEDRLEDTREGKYTVYRVRKAAR